MTSQNMTVPRVNDQIILLPRVADELAQERPGKKDRPQKGEEHRTDESCDEGYTQEPADAEEIRADFVTFHHMVPQQVTRSTDR